MAQTAQDQLLSQSLKSLHSSDDIGLLDCIDKLRSQGISHYVSLPQLVVCGDQSSGKSSVLEAISGIPFPTKDNLCTCHPTELILRRSSDTNVAVSIVSHPSRSEPDCRRLSGFRQDLSNYDDLPELIDKAKAMMGISDTGGAFSNDVLRIEISGPTQPHLTIVDLPGLIHSENKVQTTADVELVLEMVRGYMIDRRSVILAVVSAKNDYANQIVLKLAREIDPKGLRTMGIISKPDTLPVGSGSESGFVSLAMNEDVEFRLGWHVLRNRDYESRHFSIEARDEAERQFFSQGVWQQLPRNRVGIATLRDRLSKVLLEQIKAELPSVVSEIEVSMKHCQSALKKLGDSRLGLDDQRLFLLRISQSYQILVKAAVDGVYWDPFFEDARSVQGCQKRLRAVVQNLNLQFAENMRLRGHRRCITDIPTFGNSSDSRDNDVALPIPRADFIREVQEILQSSRGRELPGMFNPLIVGDLFQDQARPWEGLARAHLHSVWKETSAFLDLVISHLSDELTLSALQREIVGPFMEERLTQLEVKLSDLLSPYQHGHPITYNHYFTETVQSVRGKRLEDEIKQKLASFFGFGKQGTPEHISINRVSVSSLTSTLASRREADMDRYACSEVLDCMEAYYKVAMKCVIDNVATHVIENLVAGLGDVLSATRIWQLKPEQVHAIASEPAENQSQREHLSRKLAILQAGVQTLRRYAGREVSSEYYA
ncbi:MAG: hypothetical protein M1825_000078 [Sarcosagium campestre]|nr:MAG: hypothetical protein M1825_000078 [Sarcosagium campestre]